MGYELHILREGAPITDDECRQLGAFDPTEQSLQFEGLWLRLEEGQLDFKNPSAEQVDILLTLARKLDARLKGDDGERYPLAARPPAPRSWWRKLWRSKLPPPTNCLFQPGMRVRCIIRQQEAVVISVEGGTLAKVTIRFSDGTTHNRAVEAAGLEIL